LTLRRTSKIIDENIEAAISVFCYPVSDQRAPHHLDGLGLQTLETAGAHLSW